MDVIGLLLRVGLSLAVVIGLMWLAARALRGTVTGRGAGVVEVVARQTLGRGSAVAVVRVADKALVLGVTDGQVTMLGETDLAAIAEAREAPRPKTRPARRRRMAITAGTGVVAPTSRAALTAGDGGRLAGSILSPTTWRTTVDTMRERTVRK